MWASSSHCVFAFKESIGWGVDFVEDAAPS